MNTHVDFYFDFISPYSYLAWTQLPALCARHGVVLRPRPVLFAGLLQHWGQLGPAEIKPKREFLWKDTHRIAARWGVPFSLPLYLLDFEKTPFILFVFI